MKKIKQYKKYKPSGQEWIGEIPEHWTVLPLKRIATAILGKMLTPEQKPGFVKLPYLRAQNIRWFRPDISDVKEMWFSPIEAEKLQIQTGDLLVSEGGEVGRSCIWAAELEACYVQNSVHIVRVNDPHDPKYILYLFFIAAEKGLFDAIVNRISIAHLTSEKLKDVKFILPPEVEQKAISSYLAVKTTLIDETIVKKERLIQLLQEERTALINKAVTRGLDDSVQLKDSGVEWLGSIPKHWVLKKLRYLCKIQTGSKNTEDRCEAGTYPFYVRSQTVEQINTHSFDCEAILTAGDGVGVGKVFHYYVGKFDVHQRVYVLSEFNQINGKLLFNYLRSNFWKEVLRWNAKSTVDSLRLPLFQNFLVCYPTDPQEQRSICEFVDRKNIEITGTITKIQKEIQLLQEYRTSLINEVVTGKRSVL
ncbi:restriction endonuclease subunit S [Flavihumibacter sp. UBA7668]|uniref:restriction endonuclease subunit S n=1 Tax=Flavihumibacter sp. UBA7668 TaxID=1946542 RepID=UPI0025BE0074|nr:restriction endonuclease subunit S [Flavihumibacter sp. UBA7668]